MQENKIFNYKRNIDEALGDKRIVLLASLPLVYLTWKAMRSTTLGAALGNVAKLFAFTAIARFTENIYIPKVARILFKALRNRR